MRIIKQLSPNHGQRPDGIVPDLIVIHGTVGTDSGDLDWCLNPKSEVSYHYLILRNGSIIQLVPDHLRAWHAGKSGWEGRVDCNHFSIGVAFSNLGNGEPYKPAQYDAGGELLAKLRGVHSIPWRRVVGHYHVSPLRKTDPWQTFEWLRLV